MITGLGMHRVVMATRSRMVTEYYLLGVGTHSPHQKVAGLVLSVLLIIWLLCIWLTDKLNMAQNGSGDQHRSTIDPECVTPVYNAKEDNNTNSLFNNSQSVSVPGMGPGKSYTGLNLRCVQLDS